MLDHRLPRWPFAALIYLAALDAVGFGVIAPVLTAIEDETGSSALTLGALVGVFAIGQALGFPLGTMLARRFGTAGSLYGAIALLMAGTAAFVFLEGLAIWFPARAVMGLGSGALWIGTVLATVEHFPGNEYRRLTGVMAAYGLGGIAGPAFGALPGTHLPFAAYFVTLAIAPLAVAVMGPPAAPQAHTPDWAPLRRRGFLLSSISILALAVGLGVLDGTIPLHLDELLDQSEVGILYVAAAIAVSVATLAAGRLDPRPVAVIGPAVCAAGIGIVAATGSLGAWIVGLAVAAAGLGMGQAGSMGVFLDAAGDAAIASVLVVWSLIWSAGYVLGPVLGGAWVDAFGFGTLIVVPGVFALSVFVVARR